VHVKPNSPLNKIKVTPLASESFGVRSMCTFVETPDITVLLDAGISLCPYRFNLPPHPIEFKTIQRLRSVIANAADKATVTTISHYHFDHHTPSYEDWIVNWTDDSKTARQIYQNKTVLIKNPNKNINASQRQRAWMFQKTGGRHAKVVETADGKAFTFGNTKLSFSEAVVHGTEGGMLGWVIMANVGYADETFLFAPDVQGPMSIHTTELILAAKPDLLMLGGPPLYLAGFRVELAQIEQGLRNLTQLVEAVPMVILEHHTLRDEFWDSKLEAVFVKAQKSRHNIMTAAEYVGQENVFLESKRRQLFDDHPLSDEFKQWMKTLAGKKIAKPPI
jgi:predicted metallo-beta-lactamase superfamily hydrolase